jgi:hypothetical protein
MTSQRFGIVRLTALPHPSFWIPCQDDSFRHRDSANMGAGPLDEGGHVM